ncbi:hypothetical protein [Saccharothrix hoggarensis]|uniref:Uncharacterized protein n=1 Tax=Saccharothrix hoggarensis TaxID=913853 RepID=A0ABW3QIF2_9PSEU
MTIERRDVGPHDVLIDIDYAGISYRSKSHRCWSSCVSALVDESAEDAGAVHSVGVEVVYRGRVLLGLGW